MALRGGGRRHTLRKILDRCRADVALVTALEEEMRTRTDAELRALTEAYRSRAADGEILGALVPEVYAAVREVTRRVLGVRTHDPQVMAGVVLALPAIAQMDDGGADSTLACVFPAVLHALADEGGVHVITSDDDAASRDAERMGPVFRMLGMEAGAIGHESVPRERHVAYRADVTYGTAHEFGWDYLRDNLTWNVDECVQRGHRFAVVCDAERSLIDECRTPLIITAPGGDAPDSPEDSEDRLVLAQITIRGYLDTYDELAAVTATATPEAAEVYRRLYHLDVVPVEQPSIRAVDAATDRPAHTGGPEPTGRPRRAIDLVTLERKVQYDEVLDEQCRLFYARRWDILQGDDMSVRVRRLLDEVIDGCVASYPVRDMDDLHELGEAVRNLYPMSPAVSELVAAHGGRTLPRRRIIGERIKADIHAAYDRREHDLGSEILRELEQRVLLAVADRTLRDHLANVDRLTDEFASARPGTRDLLAEYRRRAWELFYTAEATAKKEAVRFLFHLDVELEEP
ncbi:hypothetical protein [Actinomadura alba]|nr:hypothetical protein [Actinomadura alba]